MIISPSPAPALPLRTGPLRFAVGDPISTTSNSWRIWVESSGDAYIRCRDSFKELKVSLHASGRWRMGITADAARTSALIDEGADRAWEVWDAPAPDGNGVVRAFRLHFLGSELGVKPAQRNSRLWASVIFLAPPSEAKVLSVTLFVTPEGLSLAHESEVTLTLAQLPLPSGRTLQVVVHGDPALNLKSTLSDARAKITRQLSASNVVAPEEGYLYLHGRGTDGTRFAMPAFLRRQ